ncbi:capsid cement protein [Pantoea dispersa]|uniref:DUF2190 family protein n=1 Tax=Pantoea TaxID=53335 RepID=UPI0010A82C38|nr:MULTISPECIES: capsid cement protein [Pantoea]THD40255.1 DUF2190 family protein [Pantoea sp. R102]UKY37697.1 DUF2190 family protein [Pantoea dispersa]
MAKNYLQDGKTLTFIAKEDYKSGDMVQVGDRVVIAVTDTPKGCAGTGLAEGVFILPKQKDVAIQAGKPVSRLGQQVVAAKADGTVPIGTAWENASDKAVMVAVKLG